MEITITPEEIVAIVKDYLELKLGMQVKLDHVDQYETQHSLIFVAVERRRDKNA